MLRGVSVVLLIVVVAVRGLPMLESTLCPIGSVTKQEFHCASCLQPYLCDPTGGLVVLPICLDGTVCEEVFEEQATCIPMADATKCNCDSDRCDDYNELYTDKCNADGIVDVVDCAGSVKGAGACLSGYCVDCTSYGIPDPEVMVIPPKCNIGYDCENGMVNDSGRICAADEYVSKDGICSPAPPEPCYAGNLCTGVCPDLLNCTQYYFCDPNGGVPGGPYDCGKDYFFNPDTRKCEQGDQGVCDLWTQCDFPVHATTTATTSDGGARGLILNNESVIDDEAW
ncbi:uncharacterized protein LOC108666107 [Hyalella azteca]|uniref:Uncharacterized protein LOC108666107 n=1 Tax=Hyalella azteca TaxID=294128 RepID=A0A8B7N503_HYAAZ|nr:uncharacterized protein LOC108666107 [Hyalella azteca]